MKSIFFWGHPLRILVIQKCKLKKTVLLVFILLTIVKLSNAQIILNPYFLNQGLSYNPISAGALVDESVQVSLATTTEHIDPENPQVNNFLDNSLLPGYLEPSIVNSKNLYHISYQKTHMFSDNNRITAGIQFQKSEDINPTVYRNSSFGLTTNYHHSNEYTNNNRSYWSFGLQIQLLFRKPNYYILDGSFDSLKDTEASSPNIQFVGLNREDFISNFGDTGSQNTLGLSYTSQYSEKFGRLGHAGTAFLCKSKFF